ncbi:DUF4167 domain-containing protein [Brevundimonas sp. PAMC22021]|uniref:DUF4167 domain-containing protein n=1 Tax=Brevundimonas sp. PAMC22021 TaxID=2861285 RepID=UPI001C62C017|nr:DUF4167 domain-containing protein [Brevundimonas sp. PAMC22021]QYF86630.1 DUF4167 domain-containing protein [Brevundimonas sp. PAMC22021]
MRDFKGMKRQRGRNRKPGGANNANNANPNRSWDSQGPENIKVRGNAQTVYERYQQLARDASSSGDRVLAENYQQHAEHYYRVLRALQPQKSFSDIAARELSHQGFDIDFEDESGAQAAAFIAAQQAAEKAETDRAEQQRQREERAEQQRREREERPRQERPERFERPERSERQDRDGEEGEARAEGEGGGRRESRRERWERRREERARRFEAQSSGDGEAEAGDAIDAPSEASAEVDREPAAEAPIAGSNEAVTTFDEAETPAARPARRTRTPRAPVEDESGSALPGFLTRSTRPESVDEPVEDAPRRRAPRRKSESAPRSEEPETT